ncbi:hypothetical protein SASPL_150579 [Salvia splendens]|uniref:Cyclic nucleotide-binding domain-containing protein n=1 Tax=Salvia splendens TaxID=180675 RepID=A0A8X8W6T9_SALSN|nr:hypothetical protein SASPL_150579 [Salvia splendens]
MESRGIRVGGLEFRVMGCVYSKAWIGEFCAPPDVKLLESGEKRDQLYQFSSTNDHEAGITRLSRVSAQFLPPHGSKVVKVPSGEYELQCSFLSQRGYYPDALDKANQDSICIHTAFGTSPDDHFLVFLMVMASLELNALSEKRGNDVVAVDLSIDQTPFRLDELERAKLCGARVLTLDQLEGLKNPHVQCWGTEEDDDDGDPPRLWVQDGTYPGTAFTRSIGDSTAETIGIVANPEIVVLELTQSHPFFVIASEGVFEVGKVTVFFVVGDGEFEVLATQEEKDGNATTVIQRLFNWRYTAEKLSSFGELALMYNKPFQASVQAVTNGTLWALKREDFRGILTSEFSNLPSLKLLRSVELLARLTILQLSNIADSLLENVDLLGLYVIQKGVIKITTCEMDLLKSVSLSSLVVPAIEKQDDGVSLESFEKNEGSYFGEWTLLGEHIASLSVVVVGDVVCSVLTKEKFDSVVGDFVKGQLTLPQDFVCGAVDIITKLLEVEEGARLGSQGIDSIKAHLWFHDVDWKGLAKHMVVAHPDIYLPYKSTPGNPF